ncbi:serine hydrolase [Sorangium sp. So ce1153]|uniref:serine hydrolase domain-containing protein n=1 Tax=Sorangium sp. So ce1153 TaxID=3133333 RepID=UPI003F5F4D35
MKTPSGAAFTAPKGWKVTTRGDVMVLEDVNREVSVTFIERKELEADAAIAAAWRQVKRDFARKIKRVTTPPGRRGWDRFTDVEYETTTEEARDVFASARRKRDTWYVALFDGTEEGWGRRWAGAKIAFFSLKPEGVEEESFQGKTAHVLDERRLRELESFIEEGRKAASIPGLAVAILQGGKVVFERGFGVRELGKKAPVTPRTLFRIASTTKPLTSLLPFNGGVFRRKLFEVLFDGRDEAREDLAYAAQTQEADFRQEMSKVDLEPDRAWLDHLAGTYEHPWFGEVSIRVEGNRGVFDAGEWQSGVGRKKEEDGTAKLVLTSPPWIGWPEFVPSEADGKRTLHMRAWQRKVVFEPVKGK